jgi:hypothetical protein
MNTRLDNWPALFNAYIEERRATPFAWGVHDCCMFAAGGVQAVRGLDLARGFRGYRTARGAAAKLKPYGGDPANLPAALGVLPIGVSLARRADIVCHPFDGQNALGLCCGPSSAFAGQTGLVFVDTLACEAAWRI